MVLNLPRYFWTSSMIVNQSTDSFDVVQLRHIPLLLRSYMLLHCPLQTVEEKHLLVWGQDTRCQSVCWCAGIQKHFQNPSHNCHKHLFMFAVISLSFSLIHLVFTERSNIKLEYSKKYSLADFKDFEDGINPLISLWNMAVMLAHCLVSWEHIQEFLVFFSLKSACISYQRTNLGFSFTVYHCTGLWRVIMAGILAIFFLVTLFFSWSRLHTT